MISPLGIDVNMFIITCYLDINILYKNVCILVKYIY